MSSPPPSDWTRVLVRPHFRGEHRDVLYDLGGIWNRKLDAWVIEPAPERRFNRVSGQWEDHRVWLAHWKVERALAALGQLSLEWQVGGPSPKAEKREDLAPALRTSRGWKTPKWNDGRNE